MAYKRKIEDHLSTNNAGQVWQGVQYTTSYKASNAIIAESDASLGEELNLFSARFEVGSP